MKAVTDTKYYDGIAHYLEGTCVKSRAPYTTSTLLDGIKGVVQEQRDIGFDEGYNYGNECGRQAKEEELLGGAW